MIPAVNLIPSSRIRSVIGSPLVPTSADPFMFHFKNPGWWWKFTWGLISHVGHPPVPFGGNTGSVIVPGLDKRGLLIIMTRLKTLTRNHFS